MRSGEFTVPNGLNYEIVRSGLFDAYGTYYDYMYLSEDGKVFSFMESQGCTEFFFNTVLSAHHMTNPEIVGTEWAIFVARVDYKVGAFARMVIDKYLTIRGTPRKRLTSCCTIKSENRHGDRYALRNEYGLIPPMIEDCKFVVFSNNFMLLTSLDYSRYYVLSCIESTKDDYVCTEYKVGDIITGYYNDTSRSVCNKPCATDFYDLYPIGAYYTVNKRIKGIDDIDTSMNKFCIHLFVIEDGEPVESDIREHFSVSDIDKYIDSFAENDGLSYNLTFEKIYRY